MNFNDILSFYKIKKEYANPTTDALCYVCSDTDIPIENFTQEGESENE